ncbi:MAG: hypothetical protein GEU78_07515 [Actinobacteria bacterium]|nr:hypothetical protein [Actinomycetota bacterium]
MSRRSVVIAVWAVTAAVLATSVYAIVSSFEVAPLFTPVGARVGPLAMTLVSLTALAFSVVGALVTGRRAGNPIGWLMLATGMALAITGGCLALASQGGTAAEWAEWVARWISIEPFIAVTFILLLFPDGTLLSRRWRPVWWLGVVATIPMVGGSMVLPYEPGSTYENPVAIERLGRGFTIDTLGWSLLAICLAAGAVSFVLRFRRSSGVLRLQLKWFALASALVAVAYIIQVGAWVLSLVSSLDIVGASVVVTILAFDTIPLVSGMAILRYRLYDIDLVVNRTLVYGLLTAILGAAYFVTVALTQSLLPGSRSALSVAMSTLLVAALFRPMRRRVQDFIDRRFYRRKYDAARAIQDFAARLRNELDIDSVRDDLVSVVHETMEPRYVLLWLRRT